MTATAGPQSVRRVPTSLRVRCYDPVAQARNDAIEGAIFDASKEWAIDQPAVVRIEHHGRMHQIVTMVP
jgi:hypothetical protein